MSIQNQIKILVAEDDLVSRKVLAKTLRQWDYEVQTAVDGVEAWNMITESPPHIALLDWMMPGMNGPEVIKKIRGNTYGHYIFILLLTAKAETNDIIEGLESGADDYLTKPFDRGELSARLRAGQRIIELEKNLADKNELLSEMNQSLAEANTRMKKDLDAAAEIQTSLLPHNLPQINNVNIDWFFKPCDELAGDILNVFKLDETHLGFYLLDVSGHGVGAALLSVTLSRILSPLADTSSILRKKVQGTKTFIITSPSEVAEKLNNQFLMDDESGQYFTLIYGVLDLETSRCKFTSAGHPNFILFRKDDSHTAFQDAGLPIGFLPDAKFEEQSVQLQPGDRMFLYSDGINEAMDPNDEQFGHDQLIETFGSLQDSPLKPCIKTTIEKINKWSHNEVADDMSILAIELT